MQLFCLLSSFFQMENWTRVRLDFVTILSRILNFFETLDVWLLKKVFVGGWVVAQQNRVTPSPFNFWLGVLTWTWIVTIFADLINGVRCVEEKMQKMTDAEEISQRQKFNYSQTLKQFLLGLDKLLWHSEAKTKRFFHLISADLSSLMRI